MGGWGRGAAAEGEMIVEKICISTAFACVGPTHAGLKQTAQSARVIFTSANTVRQELLFPSVSSGVFAIDLRFSGTIYLVPKRIGLGQPAAARASACFACLPREQPFSQQRKRESFGAVQLYEVNVLPPQQRVLADLQPPQIPDRLLGQRRIARAPAQHRHTHVA